MSDQTQDEVAQDGGSAFPSGVAERYKDCEGGWSIRSKVGSEGMTLRDYFAGQALQGLLAAQFSESSRENFTSLPVEAYSIADAMISVRRERT